MTSRTTYEATVVATGPTQIAAAIAAETVRQEACNAAGINIGANIQLGAGATMIAAVNAANLAKFNALQKAEQAKQAALGVARDTLRNASDFGPV